MKRSLKICGVWFSVTGANSIAPAKIGGKFVF